jgi:hypothetical protein
MGAQNALPKFRVIAIAEPGGIHQPFVDEAKVWLAKAAVLDHFSIDAKRLGARWICLRATAGIFHTFRSYLFTREQSKLVKTPLRS